MPTFFHGSTVARIGVLGGYFIKTSGHLLFDRTFGPRQLKARLARSAAQVTPDRLTSVSRAHGQ
jgi:hypothetical protein